MSNMILFLIGLLVIGAGLVVLQVFLSRKESKWPGLALPMISFFISLIFVVSVPVFMNVTSTEVVTVTENGRVVERATPDMPMPSADMAALALTIIPIFLLSNIPTVVLLAIYAACRGKRDRRRKLDKMSAHDLE